MAAKNRKRKVSANQILTQDAATVAKSKAKATKDKRNKFTGSEKGATSGYDPAYDDFVFQQCAYHGKTVKDIAKLLKVSEAAIYSWRREHKSFQRAIDEGRAYYDAEVMDHSLRKLAVGYTKTTTKVVNEINFDTGVLETVKIEETATETGPNLGAIKHWQHNRDPQKRYNNARKIALGGDPDGVPLQSQQQVVIQIPDNNRNPHLQNKAVEE